MFALLHDVAEAAWIKDLNMWITSPLRRTIITFSISAFTEDVNPIFPLRYFGSFAKRTEGLTEQGL